jgi:hypothetical protein
MDLADATVAQLMIPVENFVRRFFLYRDVLSIQFLSQPRLKWPSLYVRLCAKLVGVMPAGRAHSAPAIYFNVPDIPVIRR